MGQATFLLIILIALLVLILLIVGVILFLVIRRSVRKPPREPSKLARTVAMVFLRRMENISNFGFRRVGPAFPLRNPFGEDGKLFDVKLLDNTDEDAGYIVVNTDRQDFPINEFSLEGPCIHEKFERRIGAGRFHVIWFSPTYAVAVNDEGNPLDEIGNYLLSQENRDRIPANGNHEAHFQLIRKEREAFRDKHRSRIVAVWEAMLEQVAGASTSELAQFGPPSGNYWQYTAEGWERDPLFNQIPANTGANDTDNWSGCGPTAWAIYMGWHDLVWSPDLLRGSQNQNGTAWGTELAWNCYNDRIQMDLSDSDYLDVDGVFWNDSGYTMDGDMEKGFDYIEQELGVQIIGQSHYSGGVFGHDEAEEVQKVYEAITYDRRPIIIKTPGHFCLAGEFLSDPDSDNIGDQWVHINTGWGDRRYINCAHVEQHWYMKQVLPLATKKVYNETSNQSPAIVNAFDRWFVFWRGMDGYINSMHSDTLNHPGTGIKKTHDIYSKFGPAAGWDGKYLYLAVVDDSARLRVYRTPDLESFKELPFPDVTSRVRPAIVTSHGRVTVAFHRSSGYGIEIISSIDPERRFPPDDLTDVDYGYWVSLGVVFTQNGLSMVELDGGLYLVWTDSRTGEHNGL
jgi:hypothetical protein